MADFSTALANVLKNEGEYSNQALDKGGETYRGISRVHHPSWPGWSIIDTLKGQSDFEQALRDHTQLNNSVGDLYREKYWAPINADKIKSQFIAEEVFDTGVNMHWRTAARFLQSSINLLNRNEKLHADLIVDGAIGAKTIRALNKTTNIDDSDGYVMILLNLFQGMRYINILSANPSQEIFTRGWLNRTRSGRAGKKPNL